MNNIIIVNTKTPVKLSVCEWLCPMYPQPIESYDLLIQAPSQTSADRFRASDPGQSSLRSIRHGPRPVCGA